MFNPKWKLEVLSMCKKKNKLYFVIEVSIIIDWSTDDVKKE